ncbi:Crp/Fnr family transcriptional regulator [Epibacterium ulvae]|uniref:cAMP-binding domain of CRP or a regulatory subunit of cAMP-dependent protein kinases n=1 Tax=Epibacterium ulvae TaxID=1156985 RepID=A0A1G5PWB6_9RHOB|nr:Crp/Fnr family transcriptional regulator [Epibacterium ulvae]SCZ53540.1 cAMP-binding domain of CRP or a regulatory subunit of cAMP-dependent protein kinases [Epibacterium ulvae]
MAQLPISGFLSGASERLRDMLDSQATEIRIAAGEILFAQGDPGESLYAVMEGELELSILAASGRKHNLDRIQAGAVFGEIALFDPGVRTASAHATVPSVLRRLRRRDVIAQLQSHPDLAEDLLRLAGQRMRWMSTQFNEQVFLPLPVRLARKLLHLSPEGREGRLALSQSDLAEYIGATREAVSKTLSGWKRIEIVQVSRGGIEILDRPGLEELAEPDLI